MSDPHGNDAASTLAHAGELAAQVNRPAYWYVTYLVIFGVGAATLTLAFGLATGPVAAVAALGWGVVIAGLSILAGKQRVFRRGFKRRHIMVVVSWVTLYLAVLFSGIQWFPGEPAWWVPGAIVVSLPAFVGALGEARR